MTNFEFKQTDVYIKSDSFDLRQTLDCGQSFRFSVDENGVWHGVAKGRTLEILKRDEYIIIKNMSEK
ncbi:MAG: hypothetical protein IIU65_06245, partial [Clostridia bacterium]|nr:hypothetical protein [Clostridia bacterium]